MREIVRKIIRFRCEFGRRIMLIYTLIFLLSDNQLLPAVKHPSDAKIVATYHSEQGNRNATLEGGVFRKVDLAIS